MSEAPAPPPFGVEQRRAPRYAVSPSGGPVSVVGARLLNVSAYGVLIESLVAMEAETVLPLRLVIAGHKVDVEARVIQCAAAPGDKRRVFGIGLEFLSLPADVRERLSEVLRSTPQPASPSGGATASPR